MNVTINIPNNSVKLQYATIDANGYEQWQTVVFGEILSVRPEQDAGREPDAPASGV